MKNKIKKISLLLAALLLLACLPMTAMAEKNTKAKVATPSNMEEDFEDMDREEPDEAGPDEDLDDGTVLSDPKEGEDGLVVSEGGEAEDDLSVAEDGLAAREKLQAKGTASVLAETETVRGEAVPAAQAEPSMTDAAVTAKDLAGMWTIDGITSYSFKEGGTGALILPEHKYPFSFTIEGDELTLEFNAAKIGRAVFIAAVDGDTLTLIKEEEAGTAEFLLKKTKD